MPVTTTTKIIEHGFLNIKAYHPSQPVAKLTMEAEDGEGILSKEWLRLSLKDRIDIQEEIHSVFCIAPEESPEMIHESLKKFSFELDNNIPAEEQRAYLRCQELCSSAKSSCYINEDDFRLRFLRLGLFDIPKAARRMCQFLDCLLEGFGEESLIRPVTLAENFSKEDLKHLRKGILQILPYRDRLGRRILVLFPGLNLARIPLRTKVSDCVNTIATECNKIPFLYWGWYYVTCSN